MSDQCLDEGVEFGGLQAADVDEDVGGEGDGASLHHADAGFLQNLGEVGLGAPLVDEAGDGLDGVRLFVWFGAGVDGAVPLPDVAQEGGLVLVGFSEPFLPHGGGRGWAAGDPWFRPEAGGGRAVKGATTGGWWGLRFIVGGCVDPWELAAAFQP